MNLKEERKLKKTLVMLSYVLSGYTMSQVDKAEAQRKKSGLEAFTIYSDEYKVILTNCSDKTLANRYLDMLEEIASIGYINNDDDRVEIIDDSKADKAAGIVDKYSGKVQKDVDTGKTETPKVEPVPETPKVDSKFAEWVKDAPAPVWYSKTGTNELGPIFIVGAYINDPKSIKKFVEYLLEYSKQNKTKLFSKTHDVDYALSVCEAIKDGVMERFDLGVSPSTTKYIGDSVNGVPSLNRGQYYGQANVFTPKVIQRCYECFDKLLEYKGKKSLAKFPLCMEPYKNLKYGEKIKLPISNKDEMRLFAEVIKGAKRATNEEIAYTLIAMNGVDRKLVEDLLQVKLDDATVKAACNVEADVNYEDLLKNKPIYKEIVKNSDLYLELQTQLYELGLETSDDDRYLLGFYYIDSKGDKKWENYNYELDSSLNKFNYCIRNDQQIFDTMDKIEAELAASAGLSGLPSEIIAKIGEAKKPNSQLECWLKDAMKAGKKEFFTVDFHGGDNGLLWVGVKEGKWYNGFVWDTPNCAFKLCTLNKIPDEWYDHVSYDKGYYGSNSQSDSYETEYESLKDFFNAIAHKLYEKSKNSKFGRVSAEQRQDYARRSDIYYGWAAQA